MAFLSDPNVWMGLLVYGGVVLAAFWLAMIAWAYRDMRARSRDGLGAILAVLVVAALPLAGLLIYLLLRPRETLSEAYERSLEEEALLQEIEEKPTCPGCGQRVKEGWQVCPYCHTRLKKPCVSCGQVLDLAWHLCPHCATAQPIMLSAAEQETAAAETAAQAAAATARRRQRQAQPVVEFTDGGGR
jgi:RNA polymerase subunit RPABC4/transcription elongation factor Spt4